MAITLIAHVAANSTSGSFTTAGITTTGATLLIASAAYFNSTTRVSQIIDSNNNTWTPLPTQGISDVNNRTYYCVNPTVGASHTFTLTDSAFGSLAVAAFSGVVAISPLDKQVGAASSGSTIQGGSLTPTNTGSLCISCLAFRTTGVVSVNSSYTITDQTTSGSVVSSAIGYIIQTSIVAENPTWTLPSSMNAGVTNAVFIAGTTTAPTVPAIVSSVNLEANGTATSSAIDTTGATLLVVNQSAFTTLGTPTDSKGNTWTPLTQRTNGSTVQRMYYAANPTVGSGHTFIISGISLGSIQVAAISGVTTSSPFDVENGGTSTGDAAVGSVTPSGANSIILAGLAYTNNGELLGIDSNFKIIKTDPASGPPSGVIGGCLAFLALPVAAATNPKWYFSIPTNTFSANNAVFKQPLTPTNQTILGKANIRVTTSQTITGKARVQLTDTQTILGKARVTVTTLRTVLGKARITGTVSQTIAGKARVTSATSQTLTGKARVTGSTSQTVPGKARIRVTTTQTILGKANIIVGSSKTLLGQARLTATTLQTILGKASIRLATNRLVLGIARLNHATNQTITGKAFIFREITIDPARIFEPLADPRIYTVVAQQNEWDVLKDERIYKVVE